MVRGIAILAAIGVGLYLGWHYVFPPARPAGTDATAATPSANPAPSPTTLAVLSSTPLPQARQLARVTLGGPAPDFDLPGLDGRTASLGDYHGKVVLLNFWASWCPPCRQEMPALQRAFDALSSDGFVVLAINWTESEDRGAVEPFVKELGLTFPILLDESSIATEDIYGVIGFPTSIFIDREGIVRDIVIGPLELQGLRDKILRLLQGEAATLPTPP
jgi:peroxiredoxin